MEFRDLKTQYKKHKDNIDAQVQEVIDCASFISGKKVTELEEKLSEYVGRKHCITCGNGTDALELALMAIGIGTGDAVFVPDFTFFASGEAVCRVGAVPIFVDIEKDSFNISAESLEKAIEYVRKCTDLRPRAVIPVDLFGRPFDYDAIKNISEKYDLFIVEDGAQGFGGKYKGKRACSLGDISATSFFPAKPLGCYGDGGAIFTDNDEWADVIRSIKVHGKGVDKYDNIRIGMNSRLDTIQAGVLLSKMTFFDEEIVRCNEVAEKYNLYIDEKYAITPSITGDYYSSWAQYTILLGNKKSRDMLINILKKEGIPSMIYYQKPMHCQKAFEGYKDVYACLDYIVAEDICNRCLSLPMSAYLSDQEIECIAIQINKTMGE